MSVSCLPRIHTCTCATKSKQTGTSHLLFISNSLQVFSRNPVERYQHSVSKKRMLLENNSERSDNYILNKILAKLNDIEKKIDKNTKNIIIIQKIQQEIQQQQQQHQEQQIQPPQHQEQHQDQQQQQQQQQQNDHI